ncbi:hypothetical protein BT69DRAFT_1303137 [Atractiella rhizophila]|nr:hypothetical protein BT69DRAFT_1303137 [Atractiella rhizophila]
MSSREPVEWLHDAWQEEEQQTIYRSGFNGRRKEREDGDDTSSSSAVRVGLFQCVLLGGSARRQQQKREAEVEMKFVCGELRLEEVSKSACAGWGRWDWEVGGMPVMSFGWGRRGTAPLVRQLTWRVMAIGAWSGFSVALPRRTVIFHAQASQRARSALHDAHMWLTAKGVTVGEGLMGRSNLERGRRIIRSQDELGTGKAVVVTKTHRSRSFDCSYCLQMHESGNSARTLDLRRSVSDSSLRPLQKASNIPCSFTPPTPAAHNRSLAEEDLEFSQSTSSI